jgi:DNA-binding MarR family transcriptional regulator
MPDNPAAAVAEAMIELRRSIARNSLGKRVQEHLGQQLDLGHLGVLDALTTSDLDAELTVGTVADRYAVDPSHASRLVAGAVEAGLVRRIPNPHDARKVTLELTPRGHELVAEVARIRREWMAGAMADFTEEERQQFARLLSHFVRKLSTS